MGSLVPERPRRTPLLKKPMPTTTDSRPSANLAPDQQFPAVPPVPNGRRVSVPATRSNGKLHVSLPEAAATKHRSSVSLPVLPVQSQTMSPRKKSTTAGYGSSHDQHETASPMKGDGSTWAVPQIASQRESTTGATPRQQFQSRHQQLQLRYGIFDSKSNSPTDAATDLHSVPVRPPRRKNTKPHQKQSSSTTTPSSTAIPTVVAKVPYTVLCILRCIGCWREGGNRSGDAAGHGYVMT